MGRVLGLLALAGSEVGSVRAMCVGERSSEAPARITVMPLSPQNAHFPIYNFFSSTRYIRKKGLL
jgi:hypothetical protein